MSCEVQQSVSSVYKQNKNLRRMVSGGGSVGPNKGCENKGVVLGSVPVRSFSYSSYTFQNNNNSPPLLPLPVPKPRYSSLPVRKPSRGGRDQSVVTTPKKVKQPSRSPVQKKVSKVLLSPVGPDPNDLPKDVSKMFCAGFVDVNNNQNRDGGEKFSGSLFTISPPPSSLPLPRFSMRPKQLISCKAEAAAGGGGGVDAGAAATDDLRRLLRLR